MNLRNRLSCLLGGAALVVCLIPGFAVAQMTTEGQFRISDGGDATFSIPVDLPVAAGGFKPQLGFSYDASRTKSSMGMGWSISGHSSIVRCPRNIRADGVRGAINLDANDRFCLDGQRLILVGGTYGGNGAEYKTEFESFQKINSYTDPSVSGPMYFVVRTKDGLTKTYSWNAYAATTPAGPARALSWNLWRVQDRFGNYYEYGYDVYSSPGVALLTRINYSQNFNRPDLTVPPTSVIFDYEDMPDKESYAVAQATVKLTKRLSKVRVVDNGTGAEIFSYPITYASLMSGDGYRSIVANIKKCGGDGKCLYPRGFEYSNATIRVPSKKTVTGTAPYEAGATEFADVYGTGRKALVTFNNYSGEHRVSILGSGETTTRRYYMEPMVPVVVEPPPCYNCNINLNSGGGETLASSTTTVKTSSDSMTAVAAPIDGGATTNAVISSGGANWRFVNAYGDGRALLWYRTTDNQHFVVQYMPDGTFVQRKHVGAQATLSGGWEWGDVFGDGRPVLWSHDASGNHRVTRFNPDGTVQNWNFVGHGIGPHGWRLANLFGTGRMVYWSQNNTTHYITQLNADGTVRNWTLGGHGLGWTGTDLGDYFGEGRDIFWTANGNTHYFTRFNEDGSTSSAPVNGHGMGSSGMWGWAELFGDGRKVYWTRSGNTIFVSRFNANGISDNWTHDTGVGIGDSGQWGLVDPLGDGSKVMWTLNNSGEHIFTQFRKNGTFFVWRINDPAFMTNQGSNGYRWADVLGKGNEQFVALNPETATTSRTTVLDVTANPPDLLVRTTTLNATQEIWQTQLSKETTSGIYTRGTLSAFPVINVPTPRSVVASVGIVNKEGTSWTDYYYTGEAFDARYGGLGMSRVESRDRTSGVTANRVFRQDFPYVGLMSRTTMGHGFWSAGQGANLGDEALSYAGTWAPGNGTNPAPTFVSNGVTMPAGTGRIYNLYVSRSVKKAWDVNGAFLPTVETQSSQDIYGNVTLQTKSLLNASGVATGYGTTIWNTMTPPDLANWDLGRVQTQTVKKNSP